MSAYNDDDHNADDITISFKILKERNKVLLHLLTVFIEMVWI